MPIRRAGRRLIASPTRFTLEVKEGAPGLIDGSVTLRLTKIEPTSQAGVGLVTAVLECKGRPDVPIRNPEAGQNYDYADKHGYRVQFVRATLDEAFFRISKNR